MALLLGLSTVFFGSPKAAWAQLRLLATEETPALLTVSPLVDVGTVAPRAQATAGLRLLNSTERRITIGKIQASCRCLTIRLPTRVIEPAQIVDATAVFDANQEQDFRGNLAINVVAFTDSGSTAFRTVVNAEVRP